MAMFAARLEVVHHDDHTTVYEQVRYWLDRTGVSILDETGAVLARHDDVLYCEVP